MSERFRICSEVRQGCIMSLVYCIYGRSDEMGEDEDGKEGRLDS